MTEVIDVGVKNDLVRADEVLLKSRGVSMVAMGQGTRNGEVSTLVSVDGTMRRGRGSAEGVGTRSGKEPHSTKDGNPCGWSALGHGARGRGFVGQATFIGWKRNVLITNTGVPYKVYNSVPVVLYLKPFRTTGCTS